MNDIENLAVDANVIISALLGGKALFVFRNSPIKGFFTSAFTFNEVRKYIPYIAKKIHLPSEIIRFNLELLPLEITQRKSYSKQFKKAKSLISHRDPDDVELLALALQFNFPIWSNDKDFENAGTKIYTTAQLLNLIR